jgi:hypothetical protein
MGSCVVKTDDIREVIRQMEALKGTASTLDYKQDLLDHFKEDEYRRVKWFFYCDDRLGNTIRVFDQLLLKEYGSLFKEKNVLLRGENLGQESESPKSEMLHLFNDRKDDYPRFVTWKGEPEARDYFEQLNSNPNDGEVDVLSINSNELLPLLPSRSRYSGKPSDSLGSDSSEPGR